MYREVTLYPFEGPYIPKIIKHLDMSMKGCTHFYTFYETMTTNLNQKSKEMV